MGKLGFPRLACIATVFCVVTAIASPAQTFTTLAEFDGTDGFNPLYGSLIEGTDGNLYGTTSFGGASFGVDHSIGAGTVFSITSKGKLSTLYSFCSQPGCGDGSVPYAGLAQGVNGSFYGTTFEGGANNEGTVFELTSEGQLTTLHAFCSQPNCADGLGPVASLVQATNGNFYGTTSQSVSGAVGTIFEITPAGGFSTLYSTAGPGPDGGLLQASDGNFYGVTNGGTHAKGAVFEVTSGGRFSYLFSFDNADGEDPNALIQAVDGNFYGTTASGGTDGAGTVFELTPAGQLTTLYSFCSQPNCVDGATPKAALVQGTDGNFYGTTAFGGVAGGLFAGYGTVFQITPAGNLTTLYSFCSRPNCADGSYPEAGLVQGTDGNFYGTTFGGVNCPDRCGTVFRLSAGLGPFVKAQPNFGRAGRLVVIFGDALADTANVSFNGTPATFTMISNTAIKTTVPSGATTGVIEVTTAEGTLSSSVAFQVLPQ
jgi:uncharacterized repeat protein (TIGR03803 family)